MNAPELPRPASTFSRSEADSASALTPIPLARARSESGDEVLCLHSGPSARSAGEQLRFILEEREKALRASLAPGRVPVQETWHLSPEAARSLEAFDDLDGVNPARTFLVQPPCEKDPIHVAVQVVLQEGQVRKPSSSRRVDPRKVSVQEFIDPAGHRHLRIGNLTPSSSGGGEAPFAELFEEALGILREHGANFSHVVRTWLYLRHMERDYDSLNRVRREFFEREGIVVHPASTGIGAGPVDPDRDGLLSLHAIVPADASLDVHTLHSSSFNEAAEYGAFFSRGMGVKSDALRLYLSGTAAVDEAGNSVGGDSLEAQARRMFENVHGLLSYAGSGPADVLQITSYLKHRDDRDLFLRILEDEGFAGRPHILVEGEVCRPELLCEIELIAVHHES